MDPSKCLQILHARNVSIDPEKEEFYRSLHPAASERADMDSSTCQILNDLTSMDNVCMMNLFTTLQGERVQVYVDFNEGLKALTKEKRLTEYPNLCAAATSKFYILSHQINKIKMTFDERSLKDVVFLINHIQSQEKEKLLLVAAQHLDLMQMSDISLKFKMGNLSLTTTKENIVYSDERIKEIEEKISDALENFQSLKCDYSEM